MNDTTKRGRGRPNLKNNATPIGFKVKVGGNYITGNGVGVKLTNTMSDATSFPTAEKADAAIARLTKSGKIRVWGGRTRAEVLPRYAKYEKQPEETEATA